MSTPIDARDAHNRVSLETLLNHIEAQCAERIESIRRQTDEQVESIRRTARDNAAELLRETRRRERRLADERVRAERARQEARIRRRQLALQREHAKRGLQALRKTLSELWNAPAARSAWLARALADARVVLPDDEWRVRHPESWTPGADAERVAGEAAPDVRIEWRADSSLNPGFVVEAGRARIDATIEGLTARGERIAGVLLAELPEPDAEVGA
jgi:vacuolar-type H+-ATPase subunit E/Vma4